LSSILSHFGDNIIIMCLIGERLRDLREEKCLSLYELSKRTGISKSALQRWENDLCDIKASYLKTLAIFFDVSVDYLLGLKDY